MLLARIGSNVARQRVAHPGTPFSSVNGDPNQYFVFTETEHFDFFTLTSRDKSLYSQHLTNFLLAHRPDVVHLQHTHFIGLDLLSQIRRVLPEAAIVYTLHEFLPICHRDGQMVRTFNSELCERSLAAPLPRMLSRDQRAVLLPAPTLRQGAVRQRRPLPRAERAADGQVHALGDRAGADRGRGVRAGCAPPVRAPDPAQTQGAGQHRLLRPAQPLQGRAR